MNERQVPINKGNYSMDTEERFAQFEAYRSEGWEEEYNAYRKNWVDCAKNQTVLDYPLLVDLETSSLCNLKCPMCYTITCEFKQKVNAKLMDETLFYKVIDEIAGHVPAIRLSLRGEPTLHPKLVDFIRYAKKKGIGETSLITHGGRLTEGLVRKLIAAGIDWITISVDGTGAMYESIRKPLIFEETLAKIRHIKQIKQELGVHRPVIKIQSIWPAARENPTKFYCTFAPYADLVAFNPLIDYLDNDSDIIYEENFSCPQLYQRLIVAADGAVLMCSNDEENLHVIGNANESSIHEIWHGEALTAVRKLHKQKDGFMQLPCCQKCYLPRKMIPNETAEIDGRTITVLNYINRIQEIGK